MGVVRLAVGLQGIRGCSLCSAQGASGIYPGRVRDILGLLNAGDAVQEQSQHAYAVDSFDLQLEHLRASPPALGWRVTVLEFHHSDQFDGGQ
jgi:hypothetical protein